MSIFITKQQLRDDLATALASAGDGPLLIHSDLLRVGIVEKMKPRNEICADYLRIITDTIGNRPLLFPTFNYDFCGNGVYDLIESKAQVGVLGTYLGQGYPDLRTRTPVFNFCIMNNGPFSRDEKTNPFGPDSTFAEFNRLNGTIAFLGAGFETNTFLHYVEESVDIGYRYIKRFEGAIIEDGDSRPWTLHYRVRPLREGAAEYDWPKIESDLFEAKILRQYPVGNGRLLLFDAAELFSFWTDQLTRDPNYLLTESSRKIAEQLYAKHGSPLTFKAVEGH